MSNNFGLGMAGASGEGRESESERNARQDETRRAMIAALNSDWVRQMRPELDVLAQRHEDAEYAAMVAVSAQEIEWSEYQALKAANAEEYEAAFASAAESAYLEQDEINAAYAATLANEK